jgi:hypothetical protein
VEGWSDPYGTWHHDAVIKVGAGVDVELMLEEGARVVERAAAEVLRTKEQSTVLTDAAAALRDTGQAPEARLPARRGRTDRQREVRVERPALGRARRRRHHPRALPDETQRDPPGPPGPAPAAQPALPPRRRPARPRFSKARRLYDRDDVVVVVANLEPDQTRDTWIPLTVPELGLDRHDHFVAHDLITGDDWNWSEHNFVRLRPATEPVHIVHLRPEGITSPR